MEKTIQPQEHGSASQTDPERVPVVQSRHVGPARNTFFVKGTDGEVPRRTEEQRQGAEIKRPAENEADAEPAKHGLVGNRSIVGTEETWNAIAQEEHHHVSEKPPN